MDDGILKLYRLENTAGSGYMPKDRLVDLGEEWQFQERTIGYNRQYAAQGVGEQVDMLVRIWRAASARIGLYAILTDYDGQENESGDQYRISNVQNVLDENGLKVTDLTLYRLDELYEIVTEQP